MENRLRLLAILKMLMNNLGGYLTTSQIMDELEKNYAISVERKSLYKDMQAIDLLFPVKYKKRNGWYIDERTDNEC